MRKIQPQLWGLGQLPIPTTEHTAETILTVPPAILAWCFNESAHIACGSKLAIKAVESYCDIKPKADEKKPDYEARTRAEAQAAWPTVAAEGLDYTSAEALAILEDRAKPKEEKKDEALAKLKAEKKALEEELAELRKLRDSK